jgi:hypothetical protein
MVFVVDGFLMIFLNKFLMDFEGFVDALLMLFDLFFDVF